VSFEFAVPFCLLLSRDLKQDPRRLASIAALVFVMQFVYLAWTILPSFRPGSLVARWSDVAAPLALGGFWLSLFTSLLMRRLPAVQVSLERST
jgi:hypothetical protein